jgi:hypothetical protein
MFNDDRDIHYTVAKRILDEEGRGWEFYCQICGYRARYIIGPTQNLRKMEILDIGNPLVRHSSDAFDLLNGESMSGSFSNPLPEEDFSPIHFDTPPDDAGPINPSGYSMEVDESWITPEIEAFFDRLLAKLEEQ